MFPSANDFPAESCARCGDFLKAIRTTSERRAESLCATCQSAAEPKQDGLAHRARRLLGVFLGIMLLVGVLTFFFDRLLLGLPLQHWDRLVIWLWICGGPIGLLLSGSPHSVMASLTIFSLCLGGLAPYLFFSMPEGRYICLVSLGLWFSSGLASFIFALMAASG